MRKLTENHKQLTFYFRDNGFSEEEMLAVCLLCKTDEQAKEMLAYCKSQEELDFTRLLEKAVEIHNH